MLWIKATLYSGINRYFRGGNRDSYILLSDREVECLTHMMASGTLIYTGRVRQKYINDECVTHDS